MEVVTKNGYTIILDDNTELPGSLYYDKSNGYVLVNGLHTKTYLHRYLTNAKDGDIVDHINRNKVDNRISNLRKVDASVNNYNRESKNKLGRGIYYDKIGNRYRACISIKNKTWKLGSFKSILEAKAAYNKKATEIYGEYAYQHTLNETTH